MRLRDIPLALLAAGSIVLVAASTAHAATHHHHHHHHPRPVRPWRVTRQTILGHEVTAVTYRPGRGALRLRTIAGTPRKTPLAWGTMRHALAVTNADTWQWKTNIPEGPARAEGVWINQPPHSWSTYWDRPSVGFYSTGGIVFGARAAVTKGAANIVSGPAYLVVRDEVQTSFPWAHDAQISCGPHDAAHVGCWRSNVVRYDDGRVGIVEIGFASMPAAARVLHRLHVRDALTFDSGGSSILGYRPSTAAPWSQTGIQHALGQKWLRPVPEAVALVQGR